MSQIDGVLATLGGRLQLSCFPDEEPGPTRSERLPEAIQLEVELGFQLGVPDPKAVLCP